MLKKTGMCKEAVCVASGTLEGAIIDEHTTIFFYSLLLL